MNTPWLDKLTLAR